MGWKVYHIFLSLVHTLAFVILNEIFFPCFNNYLLSLCGKSCGLLYRNQKMFNVLEIFITLTSFFLSFSARKKTTWQKWVLCLHLPASPHWSESPCWPHSSPPSTVVADPTAADSQTSRHPLRHPSICLFRCPFGAPRMCQTYLVLNKADVISAPLASHQNRRWADTPQGSHPGRTPSHAAASDLRRKCEGNEPRIWSQRCA